MEMKPGKSELRVLTALEVQEKYGIDVVTAEVVSHAIEQVAIKMHATLMRGSTSPVIRDYMDAGTAVALITDKQQMEMVAVREGCTQHAFNEQFILNSVIGEWGLENFHEGDIVMTNDPGRGDIHQADIFFVRVVFWEGKPEFTVSGVAHFADMGGAAPGSWSSGWATSSYMEALKIPPMLIYARDVPVRPAFNLLIENTRIPHYALGDMRACCGSVIIGERFLKELITKYGLETVRAASGYRIDYTERLMRIGISKVPDGTYTGEDWLDDDGIELKPIKVRGTVKVRGDNVEVDFSGSSRQCLGNIGACWGAEATRSVQGVKMMVERVGPVNAGTFKPIDVVTPAGCICNSLPPAATMGHTESGGRVISVIEQAFSQAMPEEAVAPDYGSGGVFVWGGMDNRPGREGIPWVAFLVDVGGWGGTTKSDGVPFCLLPFGNIYDPIVEFSEQEWPMILLEKEALIDSGGAGEHRGACGSVLSWYALGDATMQSCTTRSAIPAPGANGGGNGGLAFAYLVDSPDYPSKNGVTPVKYMRPFWGKFDKEGRPGPKGAYCEGTPVKSSQFSMFQIKKGMVFRHYLPGGGGCGDPLNRSVELVKNDIENELVSPEFAKLAYGVVIDPVTLEVDKEATDQLRAELRKKREKGEWRVPDAYHPNWPLE